MSPCYNVIYCREIRIYYNNIIKTQCRKRNYILMYLWISFRQNIIFSVEFNNKHDFVWGIQPKISFYGRSLIYCYFLNDNVSKF